MRPSAIVALALAALAAGGCRRGALPAPESGHAVPASDSTAVSGVAAYDLTAEALNMADSLLRRMTLEQRVGQCFMPAIFANADAATMRRLERYIYDLNVGGVVLLKGDLRSAAIMAGEGRRGEVPLFIAIDAEWGLGMRLSDAPGFPRNGSIGKTADEGLLFDYGREVARECRRVGINMVLGPVIDVSGNPRGVIGSRSFGGDPRRVADLGVAYARGLESGAVVSVAKHFPGHGSPGGDSHKALPVIERSLHQLDSIDLYPFRSYIEAGLSAIMVGHLAVPAIDPQSLPAAVSPVVIGDLLRGELGFRGMILTDALNMGGVAGFDGADAIMAGADIVVAPEDTEREIERVLEMVRAGILPEEVIDDRCRRILFRKSLAGLDSRHSVRLDGIREDVRGNSDSIRQRLSF